MLDWLAKALDLPKFFLHNGTGPGGGIIQGTASESTLVTLLSARDKAIRTQLSVDPNQCRHDINKRLVAYSSNVSHSSVEKAGKIAFVDLTFGAGRNGITERNNFTGSDKGRQKERKNTVLCGKEGIWLHIDAAYAGTALLCPEFRFIAKGLEFSSSFNMNPHKGMMVNHGCSTLWFKDSSHVKNAMTVDPLYLRHGDSESGIDYRHWQIPLSRRFRAIKLWFVLRMVGLEGLRSHVRRGVAEAKHLEELVKTDERYEMLIPVVMGLVCFRLKPDILGKRKANDVNRKLYESILADRRFFITPASFGGKF